MSGALLDSQISMGVHFVDMKAQEQHPIGSKFELPPDQLMANALKGPKIDRARGTHTLHDLLLRDWGTALPTRKPPPESMQRYLGPAP
jgi:hypothetical protein